MDDTVPLSFLRTWRQNQALNTLVRKTALIELILGNSSSCLLSNRRTLRGVVNESRLRLLSIGLLEDRMVRIDKQKKTLTV